MSYMEWLPVELVQHIGMMNASGVISSAWRRYLAKKEASVVILTNLASLPDINAMSPYTCDVMAHCLRFVSARGDYNLYNRLFAKLNYAVMIDEYSGGRGALYYNKTNELYDLYLDKLYPNLSE